MLIARAKANSELKNLIITQKFGMDKDFKWLRKYPNYLYSIS